MVRLLSLVLLVGTSSSCVIYEDKQSIARVFVDEDKPCPPRTQPDLFPEEVSGDCNSSLRLVSVDAGPVDQGVVEIDDASSRTVRKRSCAYLVTREDLEPNNICL